MGGLYRDSPWLFFFLFFSFTDFLKKETQMLEVVKMKKQEAGCMFFRYFYNLAS